MHGSPLPLGPDPSHELGPSDSPTDLIASVRAADIGPPDLSAAAQVSLDGLITGVAPDAAVSEVPAHG